jgi:hypothetical protein
MKTYHKALSSGQGIIADEETGRTVAVVYDSKDGDILAAAPDMLAALEELVEVGRVVLSPVHDSGAVIGRTDHDILVSAVAVLEKAKGIRL